MVYRDGTIRSPTEGVLHGFAQSLVIKAAEKLGFKIVDEPITLQDARDGLWVESFVTSSVRLIIPVNRIIYENSVAPFEWTESKLDDLEWNRRRWRLLYDSIMNSCYFEKHLLMDM
jgi:branched-subunit amino acid aminotransferase/4-amino-4-deoxychorismate lyase